MSCDLYFVAGEKSGDLHGEKLIQAIKTAHPGIKIAGVGGPLMRAQGMECTLPMEEFQVMGFIDVFLALPKLIRQFYYVAREIQRLKPKAVVTIDYPGLNLRLARHLKKKGLATKRIHFICPSVWAWGKKRIPFMAKNLDLLLTILPFEKQFFSQTDLKIAYVGHPLIERIHSYRYQSIDLPKESNIVAIFPGSRKKEIERNLPIYLKACERLHAKNPTLHFALSVSDERFRPLILEIIAGNRSMDLHLSLIPADRSYELMKAAHLAIAKSGTVTLELALHKVPTVVTYAISFLDVIIARDILRIRLPFYCLVNIIAEKEVFPELFGPQFTLDTLSQKLDFILEKTNYSQIQNACTALIDQLGSQVTSAEAALAISKEI